MVWDLNDIVRSVARDEADYVVKMALEDKGLDDLDEKIEKVINNRDFRETVKTVLEDHPDIMWSEEYFEDSFARLMEKYDWETLLSESISASTKTKGMVYDALATTTKVVREDPEFFQSWEDSFSGEFRKDKTHTSIWDHFLRILEDPYKRGVIRQLLNAGKKSWWSKVKGWFMGGK